MKWIQATIAIGLFGWLGIMVMADAMPEAQGGSRKTQKILKFLEPAIEDFGHEVTGLLVILFGFLVAGWIFWRYRGR